MGTLDAFQSSYVSRKPTATHKLGRSPATLRETRHHPSGRTTSSTDVPGQYTTLNGGRSYRLRQ